MKSILEDFQPELFSPEEMHSFKIAPELGPISFANQTKDYGTHVYKIKVQGKLAGYIDYWIDPRHPTWLEIHMSRVEPAFRGRGLGLLLYQRFYRYIVRNFPQVRSIDGRVTSKGIAALRARAIKSEPRFADPGTGMDMSREDAFDYIPDKSPEDAEGNIDGVGVHMQQRIRRKGVHTPKEVVDSMLEGEFTPGFDVDPETLRPAETTHAMGRRKLSARSTEPRPFAVSFNGLKTERTTASSARQALVNILGRMGSKNPFKSVGLGFSTLSRNPQQHGLAIFDEHFQCYVPVMALPESKSLFSEKYWLSPSAKMIEVSHHFRAAYELVKGIPDDVSDVYAYLFKRGWVRVFVEDDLVRADTCDHNKNTTEMKPRQMKELKDFAIERGLHLQIYQNGTYRFVSESEPLGHGNPMQTLYRASVVLKTMKAADLIEGHYSRHAPDEGGGDSCPRCHRAYGVDDEECPNCGDLDDAKDSDDSDRGAERGKADLDEADEKKDDADRFKKMGAKHKKKSAAFKKAVREEDATSLVTRMLESPIQSSELDNSAFFSNTRRDPNIRSKKLRNMIARSLAKHGLDGNGHFRSVGHAISEINKAMSESGLFLDAVSGDLVLGDEGQRTLPVFSDHANPQQAANLHITWYLRGNRDLGNDKDYEVLAYLT